METIIASDIQPTGIENNIIEFLSSFVEKIEEDQPDESGVLYSGFPVFKDYDANSVNSKITLLSKRLGVVLISPSTVQNITESDENLSQIYSLIEANLRKSKNLRKNKKELHVPINSFIFAYDYKDGAPLDNEVLTSNADLQNALNRILNGSVELTDDQLLETRSIIEGARSLATPSRRTRINNDPKNKANILAALEDEINNFDAEQQKCALMLINGPQRIRGLAGSGKTVVLAMKAAHIHLRYPDKKILFTFYTKSLYGLIRNTIDRFYRHFAGVEPEWTKIDILHAWGGRSLGGVYYNAACENNVEPVQFSRAKAQCSSDPFEYVCEKLIGLEVSKKYDYILIDEAQDMPTSFFKLCYKLAKGNMGEEKNIVWAYDDLQTIFNIYQRQPDVLFGKREDGQPNIDLKMFRENLLRGQENDLVLKKCYRNALEVLLAAHALGFGIYGDYPVQMLENEEHWRDVGYDVETELVTGKPAVITRPRENSPLSISARQMPQEIVECFKAQNVDAECEWIAKKVCEAIEEGVRPEEILIISLDDRNARSYFSRISALLSDSGIMANNILINPDPAPDFWVENMLTMSTVYRAKGNEASLVFAIGIDALNPIKETRKARNRIFTAFTRSRAWLKVSGISPQCDELLAEVKESLKNSPSLRFTFPDLKKIETIQRDIGSFDSKISKIGKMLGELEKEGLSREDILRLLEGHQ